jgi:K+-transporting ATPase ATPase A chain
LTNTDWQAYIGESTLSYFTNMVALTVQNFISAAVGISVLIAFIRGISRQETTDLGNFWVDTVRGVLYVFIPLSLILAMLLVAEGVPQNFKSYQKYNNYQKTELVIPMGPVASQVAIKQLGTNGGGVFNANSAHPFENPTPFSNFLEMLAIMIIPAALCYMFGIMVKDLKQGWWLLAAMFFIVISCLLVVNLIEQNINPELIKLGMDKILSIENGNMEGKELRFGALNSSLWAVFTTATSNGSVNAMFDSFLPLGGLLPLWLIELGGVVFGGVGSGLCQMLIFVIITVFVAGLMIGRTPEYLGKKIEAYEMKMVSFIILVMPLTVLICSAIAVSVKIGKAGVLLNQGIHGFTEIFYAFSSMVNNNGSAFASLDSNVFYNVLGGISMLIGRYFIAIPILAIAGSLAKKKIVPANIGTLPINNPLFISVLIGIIIIITALVFLPALSLGPIVEHLMLSKY